MADIEVLAGRTPAAAPALGLLSCFERNYSNRNSNQKCQCNYCDNRVQCFLISPSVGGFFFRLVYGAVIFETAALFIVATGLILPELNVLVLVLNVHVGLFAAERTIFNLDHGASSQALICPV